MPALKGNQNLTHNEIAACPDACVTDPEIAADSAAAFEKNRGRLETRTCRKASNLDWCESKGEWASLASDYAIERSITAKRKKTKETTYYLSSLDVSLDRMFEIVRNHRKIESIHWMPDVLFDEDV